MDRQGAGLVLRAGSISAGACVLSISSARAFAASVMPDAESVQQLDAWIAGVRGMAEIDAPKDRWQRIRTEQERLAAERKLDRWLVKPTDGNFARVNRRISIPISRQLIRLPITPNMVSLFTLGMSFLAGAFFAMGGYRNMVTGAILGLFASILDGCDGEVARLKLQESEFGCWLETVCDYLYLSVYFRGHEDGGAGKGQQSLATPQHTVTRVRIARRPETEDSSELSVAKRRDPRTGT